MTRRTVTVAATDTPNYLKEAADYVCDGVADNVEVQHAYDTGALVEWLPGTFNLEAPLKVPDPPKPPPMQNLWMEQLCRGPMDDMGNSTELSQCPHSADRWETVGGSHYTYACPKHSVALAYSLHRWVNKTQQQKSDRNAAPEEKWLQVHENLTKAWYEEGLDKVRIDHLIMAVRNLYLLLEPPSVRERRVRGET